jgi:hypothetical protein
MPIHTHDCEVCQFLATVAPLPGEPRTNGVDLYICRRALIGDFTLIRRYSSDPPNYGCLAGRWDGVRARSIVVGGDFGERYDEVLKHAFEQGFFTNS